MTGPTRVNDPPADDVLSAAEQFPRWLIGAATIYALLLYTLALRWYALGYFDVYNVFFDADANTNLQSLAHGWGRHTVIHPLLETPAFGFRLVSSAAGILGLAVDPVAVREILALMLNPAAVGVTLLLFHGSLRNIAFTRLDAALWTGVFAAGLSTIVFGAMPETYALSSLLIVACFYLYSRSAAARAAGRPNDGPPGAIWMALAAAIAGVTVTNVAAFAVIYGAHLRFNRNRSMAEAAVVSVGMAAAGLVAVIAMYEVVHLVVPIEKGQYVVSRYIVGGIDEIPGNVIHFVGASSSVLLPIGVDSMPNGLCGEWTCNQLVLNRNNVSPLPTIAWLKAAGVLALWVYCARIAIRTPGRTREVLLIAAGVILSNLSIHSVFGSEMFLYTQHWVLAAVVLPAIALRDHRRVGFALLLTMLYLDAAFLSQVDALVQMRGGP